MCKLAIDMKFVGKNHLIFLTVALLCFLASCDAFDSYKQLTGRYYLNHTKFGKCLCYKVDEEDFVELVSGAFGRIGFDNNYIIVEQSKYQFSIIKIYKELNYSPEKGIIGPLNPDDFRLQKQKLNIKAEFNINTD